MTEITNERKYVLVDRSFVIESVATPQQIKLSECIITVTEVGDEVVISMNYGLCSNHKTTKKIKTSIEDTPNFLVFMDIHREFHFIDTDLRWYETGNVCGEIELRAVSANLDENDCAKVWRADRPTWNNGAPLMYGGMKTVGYYANELSFPSRYYRQTFEDELYEMEKEFEEKKKTLLKKLQHWGCDKNIIIDRME